MSRSMSVSVVMFLVVSMLSAPGCLPVPDTMTEGAAKLLLKCDCRGCESAEGEGEAEGEWEGESEGETVEEGEAVYCTVTYLAGTGGSVEGVTPQTVAQGASGSEVTAVPNTGYHFVQWSDGVLTAARQEENITADISVTAEFAINTYAITCTATGSGVCRANPSSVPHGSTSTITVTPYAHWHIASLEDSVEGAKSGSYTTTPVTADRTIAAVFAIDRYTLSYSAGTGGDISGLNFQYIAYGSDGSSVTAVANKGYHFLKWSDGSRLNPRVDENVTADLSVTALFSSNQKTLSLPDGATMELVWIRPGSFQMGRKPDEDDSTEHEDPRHEVTFEQGFWMGKYEVTQQQWLAVCDSWPDRAPTIADGFGDTYPAYNISWNDAKIFNTLLNTHITETGQGPLAFRLPSEAEWEYACRAGTTTRFYWGDDPGCVEACSDCAVDEMWYCGNNAPTGTKPVGSKTHNIFGLYDMSGNVYEWCEDHEHDNYLGAPTDGSAWVSTTGHTNRIVRGGDSDASAIYCRSAYRSHLAPSVQAIGIGFRVAADE